MGDARSEGASASSRAEQLHEGDSAGRRAAERERNTLGVDDIKAAVRASSRFNYLGDAIDAFDNQQRA